MLEKIIFTERRIDVEIVVIVSRITKRILSQEPCIAAHVTKENKKELLIIYK
jgi:hypothetical protein